MLPRANRLRHQRDFQRIFRAGTTARSAHLVLRRTGSKTPRAGFVVSTTVSKRAVIRNRLRRQMRAIVHDLGIPTATDIVIIAQKSAITLSYANLQQEIERLLVAPSRSRDTRRPRPSVPTHPLP